jgi:hypothetical protein
VDVTLDWLGVATFRLTIGDLVVFLDGYMDRVSAAPPVGLATADVDRADYVLVGHSHFDHLWGVERIAAQTGAMVIASHESVRVLDADGVDANQMIAVAGGEPIRLSDDVLVRVYPSLHSCVWASGLGPIPADHECLGDLGLTHQERQQMMFTRLQPPQASESVDDAVRHMTEATRTWSDGGALAFLIETPNGSLLWKDTSGHWRGVLSQARADVVLLAAAARPNVDGEPHQGSLAAFIAAEAGMTGASRVALCHHDDWLPPFTGELDLDPIRHRLKRDVPDAEFLDIGYLEGRHVLRGLR